MLAALTEPIEIKTVGDDLVLMLAGPALIAIAAARVRASLGDAAQASLTGFAVSEA